MKNPKCSMKKSRLICALGFCLIGLIGLASISEKSNADEGSKILRISQSSDIESLDPALAKTIEDSNIIEQLFEGLTVYDNRDSTSREGVAEKWAISEDLKTYTFFLRKDAKWSDGSKVVAGDFLYSWKRMLDPSVASPWAYQLYDIKNAQDFYEKKITDFSKVGITAPSEEILKVELIKPQPYFLAILSQGTLSPLKESAVAQNGSDWTAPGKMVSNGAFILSYRSVKDKVIIKKNPNYWDAKNVYLEEVQYYPIEDENTGFKMYETGMLDIDGGGLPLSKISVLKTRKDIYISNYLGVYFLRLNVRKEPFSNLSVRKALNLAIDKKTIAEKILKGGQKPAYNLIPDGISWYSPSKGETYNPLKARELLAAAGYCMKGEQSEKCKPFPKVEMLFNTLGSNKLIVEAIQSMLKENLGIDSIELVNKDFKAVQSAVRQGEYQIVRGGWIGDFVDPMTFLSLWIKDGSNNLTGWNSEEFDELLAKAETTGNVKKRSDILAKSEKILNEHIPFIPIYFYVRIFLKKDFVKGYYENILDKHQLRYVYFTR